MSNIFFSSDPKLQNNFQLGSVMKKLRLESPEKKTRRTENSFPPPSFSSLPDEITVNCLARISRSYYPTLSTVSKSFRSLLSSTDLYAERSHLGNTEQCLYVCLSDPSYQFPQWFTLWVNPNRTLPNSSVTKKKKKKKKAIGQLLVPIPSSNVNSLSKCIVVVGSEIYVIGGPVNKEPSSAVQILDCRSHTWRDAPRMNVARENAASCLYDGKIYVMGGCKGLEEEEDEAWAEVFDIKTRIWERIPNPSIEIRKHYIFKIEEIEGKINFGTSLKMHSYDTKRGKWECCERKSISETFEKSECVIENVDYSYGDFRCWSPGYYGKEIKGLESLGEKYMRNGGESDNTTKLVSCCGKLVLIWEGYMKHNPNNRKKIWCAQFVLDKRDNGEVWGNVEWVDVVHSVPTSCDLLHCLAVSV